MRHWLVMVFILLAASASADDQSKADDSLSRAYATCMASTTTNDGWSQCSVEEITRQEQWLAVAWNEALVALRTNVDESRVKVFSEGQQAWVKYKDSTCEFFADDVFGREGTLLYFGSCKAGVIANRIKELKDMTAFLRP
jgi:uncharacterized protein YecT (DUF1311 family)